MNLDFTNMSSEHTAHGGWFYVPNEDYANLLLSHALMRNMHKVTDPKNDAIWIIEAQTLEPDDIGLFVMYRAAGKPTNSEPVTDVWQVNETQWEQLMRGAYELGYE